MDQFYIYAKPYVTDTPSTTFVIVNPTLSAIQNYEITVTGRGFREIKNVYLTVSDTAMFDNITYFNPFSGISNLSADNPGFYGVLINSYYFDYNHVYLTLPILPKTIGYLDVIVENEAGYGRLTRDSAIAGLFFPDIARPSANGIEVKFTY
jgi:hypothetical protein